MATAYQHMKPYIRLRSFAFQRIHELEEITKQAEGEINLIWGDSTVMVFVDSNTQLDVQAFLHRQLPQAKERLAEANRELDYWRRFYSGMQACHGCNGYGETRTIVDQDESRFETCSCCGGTGQERHAAVAR